MNQDTINELRREAAIAECMGTLITEQLDVIYKEKWFKLFVPEAYGGLALSLPEGLKIEETLATIDGSLGWIVTLCSGATMFVGYLQPNVAREIFADEKVCFGGSGRASGIAKLNDYGYEVTGRWHYATGAPHNTIFTANCVIEKDGITLQNEDGNPLIQSFFFTRKEVTIHEDWNTMGLIATAGHSFEVKNVQVAPIRSFTIDSEHATLPNPVYHYPFLQFAETTIAVNTLGMAQHFLDECEIIFKQKENKASALLIKKLQEAITDLNSFRQQFYTAVEISWNIFAATQKEDLKTLQNVSIASRQMVNKARVLVQELYPFCGMIAADQSSTINRIWRDIFTASQHSLLNFPG
ncbi:acyl-CoA dehydrogenase [Ilyomonas limi]|uniref:Acyl-CoA dehydrogenase n=1 Tax=Ilyomonas limi TaxID=2575867 RepID=A0A4U3L712_9BACT|nr:acyl-CoA dehydrogenase [Ilyomonas limi]